VREGGRIVCGEEWQEKVYNTEEWEKVFRTSRICILLMAME
jgi:ribulose-5-phosphate 4-epimerase/fuculose-1-phosphate aldolase